MCTAKMAMGRLSPPCTVNGGYSVQPPAGEPPGTNSVEISSRNANGSIQKLKLLSARQRHVRCAHLHGDHPVGQSDPGGHHAAEDHEQRMHGGHRIEQLRVDELQARLEQLGADDHGHGTADEEHDAGKHQVHRADVLVIGGQHPAADESLCGSVMVVVGVVGRGMGHGYSQNFNWLSESCAARSRRRNPPASARRRQWA